jgi:thioredoxin reductase/bacterioferritin-associated ferredoxin
MAEDAGRDASISFTFEGRKIECRAGVSVAAALADAGEFHLRSTSNGDQRGLFCGMGVCQECRVNVDGQHGIRACMTAAKSGSEVCRDGVPEVVKGRRIGDTQNGVAANSETLAEPDLLVIGGGAGGLTAASIAAEAGADVVLLDERASKGGQYYKQPANNDLMHATLAGDSQIDDGRQLIERAAKSGAKVINSAEVWGAFAPAEFGVVDASGRKIYRPRQTIVATGAFERGLPVPGWTLPGVITTGAAQGMLRNYGTVPAGRIVIAGNGPLNLQIAQELQRAGADVQMVAELADISAIQWIANGLKMALNVPKFTFDGIAYLRALKKAGVPVNFGVCLTGVSRTANGLEAHIGRIGEKSTEQVAVIEADVICVGYGFQPSNEILRCLGCTHDFDAMRGHLVTERKESCETSVRGVYAVGDCAGFSGAPAAMQDGVIAAHAVVNALGLRVSEAHELELRCAKRERPRHRAFQNALWTLFKARRFSSQLATANTQLCRCESVSLGDVEAAMDDGATSLAGIKRRTRLGMGPCQGRYCAPIAADLLADRTGKPVDEYSFFAPRPPLKPVRIADLVGGGERHSR